MTMKLFDDDESFSQQPQRNCDDKNAALLVKGRLLSFFGRAFCQQAKRSYGPVGKFTAMHFRMACFEPEAFPVQGGRYTRFNYRPDDLMIV